jgi:cytochrome c
MIDTFELSKIAGAVLAALLLIFVPRTAIKIWSGRPQEPTRGYALPAPEQQAAAPAASAASAAAGFDPAAVVKMVASAKPENAQATFKKCLACHTADQASPSKAGPNLWGVVSRTKAARADFPGYSDALKGKGGEWTYADLAGFLHNPKGWLPGTKMNFAGVSDAGELADLIAYLRTLADNPPPVPN